MLADVVPLLALGVLLAVAYAHPRPLVEAGAAVLAVGATAASGALDGTLARDELRQLGPVVAFLLAILVVAECCRTAGVFTALGARLRRSAGRERLLARTFGLAAVVTVALSLDATVVLLTPVVLAATARRFVAGELACVRLANSASLLLPVANLTNLLALPHLDVGFVRFTVLMAPSWVAVLAVEYVVLRARHRDELATPEQPVEAALPPLPVFPVVVVGAMLAGFVLTSPLHLAPAWVAAAAAVVLAADALLRDSPEQMAPLEGVQVVPLVLDYVPRRRGAAAGERRRRLVRLVQAAHPSFAVYVLGLGLVVAGLGSGWWGERLADLVPGRTDLPGLLAVAALGALLANAVNNLPATLLLAPLVAPLGVTPVLALLIGINVGSSMTWTGSLANLLWRRTLIASGRTVPSRDFHLTGLVASPVGVLVGVVVLAGWQHLA